jgi:hypothetical protein
LWGKVLVTPEGEGSRAVGITVPCRFCRRRAIIAGGYSSLVRAFVQTLIEDLQEFDADGRRNMIDLLESIDPRDAAAGWRALADLAVDLPSAGVIVEAADSHGATPGQIATVLLAVLGAASSLQQMTGSETIVDLVEMLLRLLSPHH